MLHYSLKNDKLSWFFEFETTSTVLNQIYKGPINEKSMHIHYIYSFTPGAINR